MIRNYGFSAIWMYKTDMRSFLTYSFETQRRDTLLEVIE